MLKSNTALLQTNTAEHNKLRISGESSTSSQKVPTAPSLAMSPPQAPAETLVFIVSSGLSGAELAAVVEELKSASKSVG